jgi:hypothetical protein
VTPLARLADGGTFFDCLAVPVERLGRESALDGVVGLARPDIGFRNRMRAAWRSLFSSAR